MDFAGVARRLWRFLWTGIDSFERIFQQLPALITKHRFAMNFLTIKLDHQSNCSFLGIFVHVYNNNQWQLYKQRFCFIFKV